MALKNETTFVGGLSAELKDAIASEVAQRRTNMNDVVVAILARKYRVAFEPTGRRSSAIGPSGDLVLRMPAELQRTIKARAAESGATLQDEIKRTLSDYFGATFVPSGRNAARSDTGRARRRTSVEIDAEAFERARVALGTRGVKETINAALRQVGREEALARAARRIREKRIPGPMPEDLAAMRKPRVS
jgi:Arc/MetJ family transcription regulator